MPKYLVYSGNLKERVEADNENAAIRAALEQHAATRGEFVHGYTIAVSRRGKPTLYLNTRKFMATVEGWHKSTVSASTS